VLQTIADTVSTLTRPIVTIMLVGTLCYLAARSQVQITTDQLIPVVTMVIGFWFGTKTAENAYNKASGSVTNVVQASSSDPSPTVSNTIVNPAS
jgi:hypothetical protein